MIKSQDDLNTCNSGERSVDVLIYTIEKCEKLQKQLDKAERILNELAIGHQSRNKYDELIRMGKAYFKELTMTKQIDNTFTIREKVIIALLHFLINFIGKKVDGYYGHQLDTCLHEIFYPKLENEDE